MSKYLPQKAQQHEFNMQLKRREHGLKVGTYVRFPDAEKGPFVLLASKVNNAKYESEVARMKALGEAYLSAAEDKEKKASLSDAELSSKSSEEV